MAIQINLMNADRMMDTLLNRLRQGGGPVSIGLIEPPVFRGDDVPSVFLNEDGSLSICVGADADPAHVVDISPEHLLSLGHTILAVATVAQQVKIALQTGGIGDSLTLGVSLLRDIGAGQRG